MICTPAQFDNLLGMLTAAAGEPDMVALLANGEPEIGATWEYRSRLCKGRADFLVPKHPVYGRTVVEIKKTQDASPSAFSRQIFNLLYDMGAAWYHKGFEAENVVFIAIEEKYPHAIGIYRAHETVLERGIAIADRLLNKLEECERTGRWHGYTKGVEDIFLPAWVGGMDHEVIAQTAN